ncbi:MAG: transcriptional regulator, TetR family [Frankiales bacterium]|jgi:AcrR family transcriptional regulator|nr:transcriptional regulator, TetR family [Frankiales bacterium]
MDRTRSAILAAALECLAGRGVRKTTMGDVAATAGIAKATLYNHFRTKPDLLAALVDEQVASLAAACTARMADGGTIEAALTHAAGVVAGSPAVRRVAAEEPALLLPLLVPGPGRAWFQARAAVGDVLVAAGLPAVPEAVDTLLRWVVGQLLWPLEPALIEPSAALVSTGVAAAAAGAAPELQPSAAEPVPVLEPAHVPDAAEPAPVPGPAGTALPSPGAERAPAAGLGVQSELALE